MTFLQDFATVSVLLLPALIPAALAHLLLLRRPPSVTKSATPRGPDRAPDPVGPFSCQDGGCGCCDYCDQQRSKRTDPHPDAQRCVEIAEQLATQWRKEFKHGSGPYRGDPHRDGMSDGAFAVAEVIRKEFNIS